MATDVRIKIRAFPYYVDVEDPVTGRPVRQERVATRGQTAELSDVDLERAKRFEAIYVDEDGDPIVDLPEASPEMPPGFDLESADVVAVSEWLQSEKPTVDDVVNNVGDDPEVAQKVIDAENLATGNQPRSTLVDRLQAIIDAHEGGD